MPEKITAVISPRGRLVRAAWLAIPCAVLSPFFFWQGAGYGAAFLGAAALACAAAWARACSFVAAADGTMLRLYRGLIFPSVRYIPLSTVSGAARFTTPLLALAGCRVLVLYTPGGVVFVPALQRESAEALCGWAAHAPACTGEKP